LATGSFIGEGFDFPALDKLIIANARFIQRKTHSICGAIAQAKSWKNRCADLRLSGYVECAYSLDV